MFAREKSIGQNVAVVSYKSFKSVQVVASRSHKSNDIKMISSVCCDTSDTWIGDLFKGNNESLPPQSDTIQQCLPDCS